MDKGLNPHVKPGRQRPLSTLPMHNIPPTSLVQPVDQGQPTHPIPKPRIGQGGARLRRKFKIYQPIPLPKQMQQHHHCLSLWPNHKRVCDLSVMFPYCCPNINQ